jgi:hypothetical protein
VPLIPVSSQSFASLHASAVANNEEGLPDTIVVRGYLGPPTEVVQQAIRILAANPPPAGQGIQLVQIPAAWLRNIEGQPAVDSPWRIYLSPDGDCWVEVPNWGRCVAHVRPEVSPDRVDVFTVWLRTQDRNGRPERYRIVTTEALDPDNERFVSGRLVEDYMTRRAAGNVAWDEQQFGPTTGKISIFRCF